MSWTETAQRRAIERVFTGTRQFAMVLRDGTEYADGPRVAGTLSPPEREAGAWRVANEGNIEFPPFARTEDTDVVAIAVYDGTERLATAPTARVAVVEGIELVLRPRTLWVGVRQ